MLDRRTFLKFGAASAAATIVGTSDAAQDGVPKRNALPPLQRAIFDPRFAEARAFAAEFRSQGVTVSEASGDLAPLWYGDLRSQLDLSPGPIAGLTDRATLFCLEELTRSLGMKVRCRVDHHISSNGSARHDAAGPESFTDAASRLPSAGYGQVLASLASEFDSQGTRGPDPQKRTGPFSPEETKVWVSWVIA